MKKFYLLFMAVFFLILIGIRTTNSYLSDVETATMNSFTAYVPTLTPTSVPTPTNVPTGTPTPTPLVDHVVITEVFPSSNQSGEWIEIYNPTSYLVSLDGWIIADSNKSDNFPSGISINPEQYGVIVPDDFAGNIPVSAVEIRLDSVIGNGLNNSNEEVYLKSNTTTIVDALSYGSNTDVFNPAAPSPPTGGSLQRIPNIPDTDTAADWIISSTPSIGAAN